MRTRLHGPKTCFKQIRNSVTHDVVTKKDAQIGVRILHEKALNEVFVGELDSTEPSHLEIEVDKSGTKQRIKCSGKTKNSKEKLILIKKHLCSFQNDKF